MEAPYEAYMGFSVKDQITHTFNQWARFFSLIQQFIKVIPRIITDFSGISP
jgi:hypothetical protein